MALFSIYDNAESAELAAVPDRFSWFAALLPPVYALVHGLWIGLALYLVTAVALVALALVIGSEAAVWLYVLLAILIGFEATTLRRRALARRGFAYRGERIATDEDLAAAGWLDQAK